jgi:hypothetical protein
MDLHHKSLHVRVSVKSNCDERRRFSEKYTNDEVLATVGKHEPAGMMKFAEELGIKRPS